MKKAKYWLGIDVGGTRIKAGALSSSGKVLKRHIEFTRTREGMKAFEKQLDDMIENFTKQMGFKPEAIGLGLSGAIDPKCGCVYLPGKIRGLSTHKTVPYLEKKHRIPVIADNDGRLACLAEWKLGAGRKTNNLLVLTLGTGIGSGVVLNGSLLSDRYFQLGTQCGHLVIQKGGPLCLTRARGTGESLCSITALLNSIKDHLIRGIPSILDRYPREELNFEKVVMAIKNKDALAIEIFNQWIENFGHVLLNAYYAYVPDRIVLGGGAAAASYLFLKPLTRFLEANAFRFPTQYPIHITKAQLGEDAGMMGAALQAQIKFSNHKQL
jgi:glucokinase